MASEAGWLLDDLAPLMDMMDARSRTYTYTNIVGASLSDYTCACMLDMHVRVSMMSGLLLHPKLK